MLNKQINQYIDLHRTLGFKYKNPGYLLKSYASFAHQKGDTYVRTQTVLEWAKKAPSIAQCRNRLLTVRRFALAMHAENRRHEIPPPDVFGKNSVLRRTPKLLTSLELKCLLIATSKLKPNNTLRPKTYTTLFALLASTGLRIGEALALILEDITDDGLVIRHTKFRKSRIVPIHSTTRNALQQYINNRADYHKFDDHLFISNAGVKLSYSMVNAVFLQLVRSTGLRKKSGKEACAFMTYAIGLP
jgi:integrase